MNMSNNEKNNIKIKAQVTKQLGNEVTFMAF